MGLRSFAFAGGMAVALALPVQALAAYTTGSVNLRSGPGTGYGIVTTLPGGVAVGVGSCVPGWCQASYSGLNGWIAAAYLGGVGQPAYVAPPVYAYPPPPPPAYPYYAPYYGGGYGGYGGYGGPTFGFYFGGGHHHHW